MIKLTACVYFTSLYKKCLFSFKVIHDIPNPMNPLNYQTPDLEKKNSGYQRGKEGGKDNLGAGKYGE